LNSPPRADEPPTPVRHFAYSNSLSCKTRFFHAILAIIDQWKRAENPCPEGATLHPSQAVGVRPWWNS
jgi:hypothetical protein